MLAMMVGMVAAAAAAAVILSSSYKGSKNNIRNILYLIFNRVNKIIKLTPERNYST